MDRGPAPNQAESDSIRQDERMPPPSKTHLGLARAAPKAARTLERGRRRRRQRTIVPRLTRLRRRQRHGTSNAELSRWTRVCRARRGAGSAPVAAGTLKESLRRRRKRAKVAGLRARLRGGRIDRVDGAKFARLARVRVGRGRRRATPVAGRARNGRCRPRGAVRALRARGRDADARGAVRAGGTRILEDGERGRGGAISKHTRKQMSVPCVFRRAPSHTNTQRHTVSNAVAPAMQK
jgi:hypothetical protein